MGDPINLLAKALGDDKVLISPLHAKCDRESVSQSTKQGSAELILAD
jgi:hypothetical protein